MNETAVRIQAHNTNVKQLGHWTSARRFQVRAHHGYALLDLRSPQIPAGDIEVEVDLDRAVLKLLVPSDARIEHWDLRRSRGDKVKDAEGAGVTGERRVVLSGELRGAEIRVVRGGLAQLTAMFSRAYLADLRHARREGRYPTVDDPTRTV